MATRLTLCADDLGQSCAINEAIADLAARRRLNAATLMVDGVEAAAGVAALAGSEIALGLHVTLCEALTPLRSALAPSGRLPHIDSLTARAFTGRLPVAAIAAEIERQYDRFEDLVGRAPAFVDAHQHAHILPGIRRLYLAAAARRAPNAWVRTCEEDIATIWRRGAFRWIAARSALLSRGLAAQAGRLGLRTNRGFAGLYDWDSHPDLERLFGRWLLAPGAAPLIICHPARLDRADRSGGARAREYAFLRDGPVEQMVAAAGLRLSN